MGLLSCRKGRFPAAEGLIGAIGIRRAQGVCNSLRMIGGGVDRVWHPCRIWQKMRVKEPRLSWHVQPTGKWQKKKEFKGF